MKHQYVGDINDYRKYALLRALSANGANTIGICWMLTPEDGRTDGNKLSYLQQPDGFRHFDPELFDILAHSAGEQDRRRLQVVEDSGAIPQATYFNELLPDDISGRRTFMERCAVVLGHTDLVFFDPDNGLEVSIGAEKFVQIPLSGRSRSILRHGQVAADLSAFSAYRAQGICRPALRTAARHRTGVFNVGVHDGPCRFLLRSEPTQF